MYGMVLMAALAAGPQAPAGGFGFGCGGCNGCSGVVVTSGCTGCYSSCNGCTGSCHGGPLFPRVRALFSNVFNGGCGGSCHSSCHGSSCHATVTSCSGCYSSCHGSCYGTHSSCFGSSCLGSSCFGSSCHGGAVYYGSDFTPSHGCGGMIVGSAILPGNAPIYGTPMAITIDRTSEFRASVVTPTAAPARLTIEVPANVKLYVDGALTKGEGETRNFHTPELQSGKTFYYELKAELTMNGKTVTEEKRVTVKAGDTLTEQFPKLTAAAKAEAKGELSAKK